MTSSTPIMHRRWKRAAEGCSACQAANTMLGSKLRPIADESLELSAIRPCPPPQSPSLRESTDALHTGTDALCVEQFGLGVATVMSENKAPVSASPADPFPLLDRVGYASLVGGLLVVLITFFTSYSHVDVFGVHFNVTQQIGIPFLFAALAALVSEVKLASNDRCADQRAREREAHEAARE